MFTTLQKHFHRNCPWLFRLVGAALVCIASFSIFAQTLPDDAYLYYRRTHEGLLPSPGVNPSDHSGETASAVPIPKTISPAPDLQSQLTLDNGVDAANLGKGDWIWQMGSCISSLGVADIQGVINYEKNKGMQWITVKCGDGGSIYPSAAAPQFTADLVNRAHAAGLKIFGWAYAYGANVPGEISVATNCLGLGADGFIIDAETEYEVLANNSAAATAYCQGIRAAYPNRFLAHAPYPIISSHSGFPYIAFGTNCDAVMPQAYWADIGGTNYAVTMVTRLNTEWRNWQNGLTGFNTNAIKPIAPIGQGYNSVNGPVDGLSITNFINALKTNSPAATAGGYRGVSWWSCQHHGVAPDKWPAIGNTTLSTNALPPTFSLSPRLHRAVDTGASVSFTAAVSGSAPLKYQWTLNGAYVAGATTNYYNLTNAQTTNSGFYTLIVTNTSGSVTSSPVSLLVFPQQATVFADNFDVDTATNWILNRSSADNEATFNYNYAALGIPSAPNSTNGSTFGVQLKANLSLGAVAAVSLSPTNQNFSGDYRVRFDGWINVNGPFPGGGLGSTEYLTAGVGTAGTNTEWTGNAAADGYYFSVNGDGGSTDTTTTAADFNAYSGTAGQLVATGDYWAGTDATARGNGNAYYQTALPNGAAAPAMQLANYPQQSGNLNAGTLGMGWHDFIVSKRGSTVDWVVDGIRFATISNATLTASNVFVGFWDPFPSLSSNNIINFGLVDNVRVESPAVLPSFTLQPIAQTVKLGTNVTFTAAASGLPLPNYQWRLNGTNLPGATNSNYTLAFVAATNTGHYSVMATNLAGLITSTNALLALVSPVAAEFEGIALTDGKVQISFTGDAYWTYTIETSTNLTRWSAYTNLTSANGVFNFNAGSASNAPQQFFRARVGP